MTSSICRQILDQQADPQQGSPLYTILPAEVRTQIFTLVLTEYPTPDPNDDEPIYSLKRKTDVEILRTCKAIYKECWYMPFILAEHSVREFTSAVMPPVRAEENTPRMLEQGIQRVRDCWDQKLVTINSLRIFPQKPSDGFDGFGGAWEVLDIRGFDARKITFTIRHGDWGEWQQDAPLRIKGGWIPYIGSHLPPSLEELCIEMETVKRKKDQLYKIADKIAEKWFFKKSNNVVLFADPTETAQEETTWRGSSAYFGRRWVRDESEYGQIDYHVLSMRFLPKKVIERKGGNISKVALESSARDKVLEEEMFSVDLPGQGSIQDEEPFVYVAPDDFWCGTAFLSSDDNSDGESE
ncbi:hypothetical protein ACHAPJ_013151 [Fusarium lateritium]